MARPRNSIPSFRESKGRFYTRVDGEFVSLGRNLTAAKARYAEILARVARGESFSRETAPPVESAAPVWPSIAEVCLAFVVDATERYRHPKTGRPTAELDCHKSAIKPLREMFGELTVDQFGPSKLRLVREQFIAKGWSRGFVNKSTNRLRHVVKWAVGRELCPPHVLAALQAVEPLLPGRSAARETTKRQAVDQAHLDAVREKLEGVYRDIFDLLLLTGCRPSELLSLTSGAIDHSGPVWVATIDDHKNAWRGLERKLHFGPKGQLILRKHLSAKPSAPLFPLHRETITRVIRRACLEANVPPFTAYSLRHTVATAVRDELGIEAAQGLLGHAAPQMTAHYSSKLDRLAESVAAKIG